MSAANDPVISLKHVGVSYWLRQSLFSRRKFWALRDVSFDLFEAIRWASWARTAWARAPCCACSPA